MYDYCLAMKEKMSEKSKIFLILVVCRVFEAYGKADK